MRPVLAAAEVVGHVAVLLTMAKPPPGVTGRFVAQGSVESLASPLSLLSEFLSLPERKLSSPVRHLAVISFV
jgi:hypothetical protein